MFLANVQSGTQARGKEAQNWEKRAFLSWRAAPSLWRSAEACPKVELLWLGRSQRPFNHGANIFMTSTFQALGLRRLQRRESLSLGPRWARRMVW